MVSGSCPRSSVKKFERYGASLRARENELKMPWQKNIWMASLSREIPLHLKMNENHIKFVRK